MSGTEAGQIDTGRAGSTGTIDTTGSGGTRMRVENGAQPEALRRTLVLPAH